MPEEAMKLYQQAKHAGEVLFYAHTLFPFTPFPDKVSIDREKLSIEYNVFFGVSKIVSTPLNDIEAVDANIGPIFGSLRITSKFFVNNTRYIRYLSKHDAERIQHLLQGFKLAKEKDVNLAEINKVELVEMLCRIGQTHTA